MWYEANKMLKSDLLPDEIQQTCRKLKLPEKLLKMSNLIESKILSVEMEIEKNTPKYDSYNPHQFKQSNVTAVLRYLLCKKNEPEL